MKLSIVRLINFHMKKPAEVGLLPICRRHTLSVGLASGQTVDKQNSRTNISQANNIRYIRQRLGCHKLPAKPLCVSQGNVSFYELGQDVPPKVARKIIAAAARSGIGPSYDDIYSDDGVAA